jgi:NADP-dependent 3-hydroxy acid dehydrogenase YdfG
MMAKALEENGAKVYIIGRRLESLEKAAKQAVCSTFISQSKNETDIIRRNSAISYLCKAT